MPETVLKNNRHKELKMEAVQIILDEKQLGGYLFCYKERWEIENCVGYMKNCVVKKPPVFPYQR